jgi:hypothetical protein
MLNRHHRTLVIVIGSCARPSDWSDGALCFMLYAYFTNAPSQRDMRWEWNFTVKAWTHSRVLPAKNQQKPVEQIMLKRYTPISNWTRSMSVGDAKKYIPVGGISWIVVVKRGRIGTKQSKPSGRIRNRFTSSKDCSQRIVGERPLVVNLEHYFWWW